MASAREIISSVHSSVTTKEVDVIYMVQGRYGRNTKHVRKKDYIPSLPNAKMNPLETDGCLICKDTNHLSPQCTLPMNTSKAAGRRLEYYHKNDTKKHAVHIVLTDLCRKLDAGWNMSDDDSRDDVQIFLSALHGDYDAKNGQAKTKNEEGETYQMVEQKCSS